MGSDNVDVNSYNGENLLGNKGTRVHKKNLYNFDSQVAKHDLQSTSHGSDRRGIAFHSRFLHNWCTWINTTITSYIYMCLIFYLIFFKKMAPLVIQSNVTIFHYI